VVPCSPSRIYGDGRNNQDHPPPPPPLWTNPTPTPWLCWKCPESLLFFFSPPLSDFLDAGGPVIFFFLFLRKVPNLIFLGYISDGPSWRLGLRATPSPSPLTPRAVTVKRLLSIRQDESLPLLLLQLEFPASDLQDFAPF